MEITTLTNGTQIEYTEKAEEWRRGLWEIARMAYDGKRAHIRLERLPRLNVPDFSTPMITTTDDLLLEAIRKGEARIVGVEPTQEYTEEPQDPLDAVDVGTRIAFAKGTGYDGQWEIVRTGYEKGRIYLVRTDDPEEETDMSGASLRECLRDGSAVDLGRSEHPSPPTILEQVGKDNIEDVLFRLRQDLTRARSSGVYGRITGKIKMIEEEIKAEAAKSPLPFYILGTRLKFDSATGMEGVWEVENRDEGPRLLYLVNAGNHLEKRRVGAKWVQRWIQHGHVEVLGRRELPAKPKAQDPEIVSRIGIGSRIEFGGLRTIQGTYEVIAITPEDGRTVNYHLGRRVLPDGPASKKDTVKIKRVILAEFIKQGFARVVDNDPPAEEGVTTIRAQDAVKGLVALHNGLLDTIHALNNLKILYPVSALLDADFDISIGENGYGGDPAEALDFYREVLKGELEMMGKITGSGKAPGQQYRAITEHNGQKIGWV